MKVTVVDEVYDSYNLPMGTFIFAKEPDSEPDCWWNTPPLGPLRSLGMILKCSPSDGKCSPSDGHSTQSCYTILFADGSVHVEFENYVANYYNWELRIK